nr:uncharacterized protein K02A2.6-like [Drosophila bipectinata]
MELDEDSKTIMVVNTPLGLFQYQRLPYGIASAPAIFQRYLEQLLKGVEGCGNYLDDIIISAPTSEQHLKRIDQVLSILRENGIRCKKEKCFFFKDEIEYLGRRISAQGILPDSSGLEAVKLLRPPSNLQQLEAFMGKHLPLMTSNRLQRWAIILMAYIFEIQYRSTSAHGNADALSRLPVGMDPDFDREEEACHIEMELSPPINSEIIRNHIEKDKLLKQVLRFTPNSYGKSPAELIHGRPVRTVLSQLFEQPVEAKLSATNNVILNLSHPRAPRHQTNNKSKNSQHDFYPAYQFAKVVVFAMK